MDTSWNPDPGLLIALTATLAVYMARWRRTRATVGPRGASGWRLVAFAGGILSLAAALVSPLDRIAEQLAVMHMVQHLLLLDLAPILLIAGLTKALMRPVTRELMRLEHAAGPLAHPVGGVLAYVVAMCVYHVPAVYDLTLRSDLAHVIAHMGLAAGGMLYWWHLLSPVRRRRLLGVIGPVVYMASTKVAVGLPALALGFAPVLLYDAYASQPEFWGLTHLQDQRAAGLFMALEQSLVMGVALVALFFRALADAERADQRAERFHGQPAVSRR